MRFKFIALLLAAMAFTACETEPVDTASTTGTGGGAATAPVERSTTPERRGISPGSKAEFAVNVGDRVYFDFDKYSLTSEAWATLGKQAGWLRLWPRRIVTIEGHADERGTREYNLALAERRAAAVRDHLMALGVDGSRISIISYGKERPIDPRSTKEAWTKNRRGVTVPNESGSAS